MKVVTITITIKPQDDPDAGDRDWNEVAKAARLVAHDVTREGLPTEGQATISVGERTTAYVAVIELEDPA